ncbi:formate--tetrahydrofolate ligase, partial [Mycobacterium tuberculosis]|nr:formate--tetrahydrofolate ligase [Mycobacterium tuberculosis]
AGIEELAHKVVSLAESGSAQFSPLYEDELSLFDKIETVVKRIYRGAEADADASVREQLRQWEAAGYGHLPVCMAKT